MSPPMPVCHARYLSSSHASECSFHFLKGFIQMPEVCRAFAAARLAE